MSVTKIIDGFHLVHRDPTVRTAEWFRRATAARIVDVAFIDRRNGMPPDVQIDFPTDADANLFAEEILHKFQMRVTDPAKAS